jgi:transposase
MRGMLEWTAPTASMCQNEVVEDLRQGTVEEKLIRVGMDTYKQVFQLHGVNAAEEPVLRRKLRRKEMMAFFQRLGPTVVGIEACGGAHHWARVLQEYGHQVKLLPPQYAKPTSSAARTMPRTPRRCARR